MAGRELHAMTRDNKVSVYVTDKEKRRIQREANEADMSVSAYILASLEDRWTNEDIAVTAERTKVEERVERITTQATDEMEAMLEQMEQRNDQMADMVARSAVYSIGNFEALKYSQKLPEEVKTNALKIGSRRLREPLDVDGNQEAASADRDLPDDLAPAESEVGSPPESTAAEEDDAEESSGGIKEGFFDRYA